MQEFAASHWAPEEQTIAKMRSPDCGEAFDLHMFPVGGPSAQSPTGWAWIFQVACMTPRSRGWLRLTSADPQAAPAIDHRYLTDVEGYDAARLADGIEITRALAAQSSLRDDIGKELLPGPSVQGAKALADYSRATNIHYYHPVGTCRMGPASDADAVVDPSGRVHGLDNAYIADASIVPVIPRANTNVPVVVVAEKIARAL
jgi:choline dehydrogenase